MVYDRLLKECSERDVDVYEMDLINKGLYSDGVIAISSRLQTTAEKACVLAEEMGHYETTAGDILDQNKVENIKQEKRARNWGYEKLVTMEGLIAAYQFGCKNRFEIAEYLEVTEAFLDEALQHYKEKYGTFYPMDHHIIYFDPLGILELYQNKD